MYKRQINDIEHLTDVRIERNRRNGRKRALDVQYMNLDRQFKVANGECTNGGRPSAKKKVEEYFEVFPDCPPKEAAAALGAVSYTHLDVYKRQGCFSWR